MFRKRSATSSKSPASGGASSSGSGHSSASVLGGRQATSHHSSHSSHANSNGASASGGDGGGRAHNVTPVLIQRLIVLHDGLMPLPVSLPPSKSKIRTKTKQQRRRNPQLSEDASLEEHGEFILYYFDHSLHFSQGQDGGRSRPPPASARKEQSRRRDSTGSDTSLNTSSHSSDYATEEAVRFAGICRALRSLPLTLKSESHDDNNSYNSSTPEESISETDVVHLNESTLVFVPLELGGDIVAIAQIPRAANPQSALNNSSDFHLERSQSQRPVGFGANPSAIEEAIRHIHAAFSLLFGGGIHKRLLRTKHLESSKEWVLEVIVDDDEGEEESLNGSVDTRKHRSSLRNADDSVWEVSEQVELVETEFSPAKIPRRRSRKPRHMKKLSSSFTLNNGATTIKSVDFGQAKKYNPKDSISEDYRYGGMEELFNLRKERRKLSNELKEDNPTQRFGGLKQNSRWESNSNAEDLFNDIANDMGHNDCERRIDNLLYLLPITKLREDLVKFYDEWLCQLQGVCEIMRGGVGRCVVEMVPRPMGRGMGSLAQGPVRGQHPPSAPVAFVCLAAAEFMKSLIHQDVPKSKGQNCRLFGMSLFHENRVVVSEFFQSHKNKSDGQFSVAPEILYFIAGRFRSSQKMHNEKATKSGAGPEKIPQDASDSSLHLDRSLTRWMSGLSMGATVEEPKPVPTQNGNKNHVAKDTTPGYLEYPSSSKTADVPSDYLHVRSIKKNVWLQRVHLPSTPGVNAIGNGRETETYVAMFESKELSFLLFFEMPSSGTEESVLAQMVEELQPKATKYGNHKVSNATLAFTEMLVFLSDQLFEFCGNHTAREKDPMSHDIAPIKEINSESVFPGEIGMDIIYIDRDESSFVLLSQHDLSSNEFKRKVSNKDSAPSHSNGTKPKGFGLFGMGAKPKEADEQDISCRPSRYTSMLDCRHRLAAYLPLDVMLAFDDMFNEIGKLSYRKDVLNSTVDGTIAPVNNDTGSNKSMELCTFLPQGWVYGRAFCNVELYILLDTSKFVTINDVQKAVTRVRERVFNDKIR